VPAGMAVTRLQPSHLMPSLSNSGKSCSRRCLRRLGPFRRPCMAAERLQPCASVAAMQVLRFARPMAIMRQVNEIGRGRCGRARAWLRGVV